METVDDGLRVVCIRKHPAIAFCLEGNATLSKPLNRVLGLPSVKGAT